MRWTMQDRQSLRQMFLEDRLPIATIAIQLNRSTASINTVLTKFGIPRERSKLVYRAPARMTPALARVHAHVCGDGYMRKAKERDDYGYLKEYKRGNHRWRYGFAYTNFNDDLIRSFIVDVKEAFGLTGRFGLKQRTVYVKSRAAWDWLRAMGAGKSREWFIPRVIRRGHPEIRIAWTQAFFDDEGHFESWGRIRARSVNRRGLEQLARMLRPLIPCHITPSQGLYPDGSCYLVIPAQHGAKFLTMIGSIKMKRLPQPTPSIPLLD